MKRLARKIKTFQERNNLTDDECAKQLKITTDELKDIYSGNNLDAEKTSEIITIIKAKSEVKNKKLAIKMLDLIFRFVAMVMALVTLILCINENVDTKVLIVLLSIGLVCSSMTILPKIEK